MIQSSDPSSLLPIAQLLVAGGDERIAIDPATGVNKYGLPPAPEPDVAAYGSSTASAITLSGFPAAERMREKMRAGMARETPAALYARELDLMRTELRALAGETDADIVFADSGTTCHLAAAQMMARAASAPLTIIMMTPAETGRGVPAALAGRHFSRFTPSGGQVAAGDPLTPDTVIHTQAVALREADGAPRPLPDIDAETEALTAKAVASGHRVLINPVDCAKTGIVAPGPRCAMELKRRYPDRLEVFVDACQYRLTPRTLRLYLEQGFMVALTGSKFMSGPSFSGALYVPRDMAGRLREIEPPAALGMYAARAEWPEGWRARQSLPERENFGLLLRWAAALSEMRAFHALPEAAVTEFFKEWAGLVRDRLADDPAFESVPVPGIDRSPFPMESWDAAQTIFPFLPRKADGSFLSREETKKAFDLAGKGCSATTPRVRLGQPVECGTRNGAPVSALRLCMSAQLATDALSPQGRGKDAVMAETLSALDAIAAVARSL